MAVIVTHATPSPAPAVAGKVDSGAWNANHTIAGLAAVASSGSASDLDGGTLLAARLPAFAGGDVTSAAGSAVMAIGANKVTRAMLAQATGATLLGATAAGNVTDLTAVQAKTFLAIVAADVGGLGTVATLASDVDTALAANSDTRVATQRAVKAYIDASVVGLLDFKGSQDCSANPNYPAALKGDAYYASVAGRIGGGAGKSVDIGDVIIASADNAGGTEAGVGASWFVLEHNLTGALVAANNLSDLQSAATARANLGLVAVAASGSASDLTAGTLLAARLPAFAGGDVTSAGGSAALAIGANKVTRGMLAQAAGATILGATGAGNVTDLTAAQAKTFLAIAAADVSGLTYFATGTDAGNLTGTIPAGVTAALTGDVTKPAGSNVTTVTARCKRTEFAASGTWTKDSRAVVVVVECYGAGGGGGGGKAIASGTAASGGGAGGGGGVVKTEFAASVLGGTETITIGAAGTAGSGGTSPTGGGAGGNSTFGAWVTGYGGGGGGPGGSATTSGGGGGAGASAQGGTSAGANGAAGGANGSVGGGTGIAGTNSTAYGIGGGGAGGPSGAAGVNGGHAIYGGSGGGSGAGLATTPAILTGGSGGLAVNQSGQAAGGNPGTAGGTAITTAPGRGGGGGNSAISTNTAGTGGAGQAPCGGGGGGGAALTTGTAGNGGLGGTGLIVVTEWF